MYVGMDTFHLVLSPPTKECEACEEYESSLRSVLHLWCRKGTAKIFSMHSAIPRFGKLIDCEEGRKWRFASTAWYHRIFQETQ